MTMLIPKIEHPELFFGFVAPIGADVKDCVNALSDKLKELGYLPVELKVTDIFTGLSNYLRPSPQLTQINVASRYSSYIKYGNKIRATFNDDAALAVLTIARIAKLRTKLSKVSPGVKFGKIAYIIHQFKRKEEIDLLRSVYGQQFFQISVYSRRGARVDYLAQRFANTANSANRNEFRASAEQMVQVDYNEAGDDHGQKIVKIFHDAEFIVNNDIQNPNPFLQIERFCNILFGSNSISPTKIEYGMYIAKAAALRTLDLSRQVGAAIFSSDGDIISLGSNEVPKAGGGTYWCDDPFDDREFVRNLDSNEKRKHEILSELFELIGQPSLANDFRIKDSQFMDALEYGRIIHAEMSAIIDSARSGKSTKSATLHCTTFPCHMCAKHIVGAGIDYVYFLEPYPKSLVADLHNDSVIVEGNDRGHYSAFPSVKFEHFFGVAPRRYREFFERGGRKENGQFKKWMNSSPMPNLNVTSPIYVEFESR